MQTVVLAKGKEQALLRGHLWIFSGAVARISGEVHEGETVAVQSARGEHLGYGFYGSASIAVRIVTRGNKIPGPELWAERLCTAWQWRQRLGLPSESAGNAFRLFHGEGDGIPGLVIDVYGSSAVVQPHHAGIYRLADEIGKALLSLAKVGLKLDTIYLKASGTLSGDVEDRWLHGDTSEALVRENDFAFQVNWAEGQKTGFFLDQRENRSLLARYAAGMEVLNTFSYTGGFSLAALKAGATSVCSVDVSAKALAVADKNAQINGVADAHSSVCQDTLKYLQENEKLWDIVVLDPPAYAKSMHKRHNAVMGYKRLNAAGMEKVKPGGLLFTFSCSQVVDRDLFRNTVAAAGMETGRNMRILHELSQSPDHPVNLFHPEGAYLKGLVLALD
jgi:23S rRNA (cytosine1962-C5)-methyltransferase